MSQNDEEIQNEEENETQEPLLGPKQQPTAIIAGAGLRKMSSSEVKADVRGDVITSLVGEWGWWQVRTTLILYLTKIPAAWFMACIIFTAPQPWYGEYECDLSKAILNEDIRNGSFFPSKVTPDGSFINDYCRIYTNETKGSLMNPFIEEDQPITCDTFLYNLDRETTLITQFDLVCSRSILVAITQCFHLFGVLLGGIIATEAMEFVSPRQVMMSGMILQIIFGIATGYVPYFWIHVAFRCIAAACCALTFTPGAVIMADIWGGKYKTIINSNFEHSWSVGVILLPAIGYFSNTWGQIYISISLPTVLIMLLWWWIPDPPRWHLERSNIGKAQEILENAMIVNNNKTVIPENMQELLKMEAHELIRKRSVLRKSAWRQLLAMKGVWWRLIFVITSWSLMFTCYYGTLLNIRSFGREYLYFNTAIAGLCEIIGGLVGFIILMQTKHKWILVGVITAITGVLNCTIWYFPTHVDGSHTLLDLMSISMLNKIGISASLCVLTTCTAELFPLPHKKRVIYASTICARTVFITAPLIGFTVIFGDGIPLSFFGVLTTLSGLLTIFLSPVNVPDKENNNTTNVWTVNINTSELTKL